MKPLLLVRSHSGFDGSMGANDEYVPNWLLRHIETLIGTFRDAVGPDFDLNLDLNFHFKPEACMRIAQVLEPYNMHWLEIDRYDPDALLQIKQSTTTKICTGENLYYMHDYIPYFERHAADVFVLEQRADQSARRVGDDVYVPAGHDGQGLPLLVDLAGFTGSGLSHTNWVGFREKTCRNGSTA